MARRMSINANGNALGNDAELFFKTFAKVKPDAAMIMDNPVNALRFYYECLNKGGTLFYRSYDKLDGDYHLKTPAVVSDPSKGVVSAADQLARELAHWEAICGETLRDKFVFAFKYNEPAAGNLDYTLKWIIDFAKKCKERAIRVTGMEWAVAKSMNQAEIAGGQWDTYLRESDALRGFLYQTTHDYQAGVSWLDYLPATLLDFEAIHPRNAPKGKKFSQYLAAGSYEAPNYHLGRETGLYIKRATELKLSPFTWYWTECFIDEMNDLRRYQEAKANYPNPPFSPMKGIFGHARYYAKLLGKSSLTDDELADIGFEQWRWIDETLDAQCAAMMAFTASFGTEWDTPHGTNFFHPRIRNRFWERVAAYHDSLAPAPAPNPAPIPIPPANPVDKIEPALTPIAQAYKETALVYSTLPSTINVRSLPFINKYTLLAQLARLDDVQVEVSAMNTLKTYKSAGYEWARLFNAYRVADCFVALYKLDKNGNRIESDTFAAVEIKTTLPIFARPAISSPVIETTKDERIAVRAYLDSEQAQQTSPVIKDLLKWLKSQIRA